jgi:hypothetical protein
MVCPLIFSYSNSYSVIVTIPVLTEVRVPTQMTVTVVTPSITPSSTGSATSQTVTLDLNAQNRAFDKNTLTVSAGSQVTNNFDNKDNDIPHNFAL